MNQDQIMLLVDDYANCRGAQDCGGSREPVLQARAAVVEAIEALTKDAERYRFVKDLACQVGRDSESIVRLIGNHKHLDALIDDSRMAKAAQKGQA